MITYTETEPKEVTKICCPACKEQLPRVGLPKGSIVDRLSFKCKKCGKFWELKTK